METGNGKPSWTLMTRVHLTFRRLVDREVDGDILNEGWSIKGRDGKDNQVCSTWTALHRLSLFAEEYLWIVNVLCKAKERRTDGQRDRDCPHKNYKGHV